LVKPGLASKSHFELSVIFFAYCVVICYFPVFKCLAMTELFFVHFGHYGSISIAMSHFVRPVDDNYEVASQVKSSSCASSLNFCVKTLPDIF